MGIKQKILKGGAILLAVASLYGYANCNSKEDFPRKVVVERPFIDKSVEKDEFSQLFDLLIEYKFNREVEKNNNTNFEHICENNPKINDSNFSNLWDLLKDYNSERNKIYVEHRSEFETENFNNIISDLESKANENKEKVVDYVEINFPKIIVNENRDNTLNYKELKKLCRENGKLYTDSTNYSNYNLKTIIMGDIVEDKPDNFIYKGEKIDYSYITFERTEKTIEDVLNTTSALAWWSNLDNTVYIDLTNIRENGTSIYLYGYSLNNSLMKNTIQNFMIKELYEEIMEDVYNEHPILEYIPDFLSKEIKRDAFVKRYEEIQKSMAIVHERMHKFHGFDHGMEEGFRTEKETFLAEAIEPGYERYIGDVFLNTNFGVGKYKEFYDLYRDFFDCDTIKCTEDKLKSMSPQKRAEVSETIYNNLEE